MTAGTNIYPRFIHFRKGIDISQQIQKTEMKTVTLVKSYSTWEYLKTN